MTEAASIVLHQMAWAISGGLGALGLLILLFIAALHRRPTNV